MSKRNSRAGAEKTVVAQFSAFAGTAPFAAFLMHRTGRIVHSNAAARKAIACDGAEIPGQAIADLFSDFSEADLQHALAFARGEIDGDTAWRGAPRHKAAGMRDVALHIIPFCAAETPDEYFAVICSNALSDQFSEVASPTEWAPDEASDFCFRASAEAGEVALWHACPVSGRITFCDTWHRILGYEPGSIEPTFAAFLDLMRPEDRARVQAAFTDLVEDRSDSLRCDFRLRDASGDWRWIGARAAKKRVSEDGADYMVCGTQMDITGRKVTEEQLAAVAEEALSYRRRLDHLAENSPVGLYEFRVFPDGRIEFPYISQGVMDTLGITRDDLEADGRAGFRHIPAAYRAQLEEAVSISQADLSPLRFRHPVDHPTRGTLWVQANSMPARLEDQSTIWHGSLYDVTPEVQHEEQLQAARDRALQMQKQMEELALHDVLTDLPNRRYFEKRLHEQREKVSASGKGGSITLIRVDLDHFKYVNDNLGHEAGDAVLIHVAELLRDAVRDADFVARIGGDEFSIIVGQPGSTEIALNIVTRAQARLGQPFLYGDQICRFGASFGIATCDMAAIGEGELQAFADAALYEAKKRGRNRVEIFTQSLHRRIIENRRLTSEIEDALERGEFEPVFQPQFCTRDRKLVGIETLARWHHPDRGVLDPHAFMTVAEQIRVVPLIDQMMLEKTREILARWREAGFVPPKVSFNVSSGRLCDPEILNAARLIRSEGTTVAFELVESMLVEDESDAFRFNLDALKDSGLEIEIDDFGSGHASILAVMEAEPSVLKIDKRLTRGVAESLQARELIAAVIRISRAFNILTAVEGVETAEQATILTDLGCDILQGFYFARPMSEADLLNFVTQLEVGAG